MIDLIFPRRCVCCDKRLAPGEQLLCLGCLATLPRVRAERPGNEVEARLFGRFAFEHATSFVFYTRKEGIGRAIRQAKFDDQPWLNTQLTRLFVQELQLAAEADGVPGWPYDVDVIVPVPIHWLRLLQRGYNQTLPIAEELSRAWHLPVVTGCLVKRHFTTSQVGRSGEERRGNVNRSFAVRHPERLQGRHVLLVDDVLTTGSTLQAAADALLASVPGVRISLLTLSFAN